jgi:hypothetical protein
VAWSADQWQEAVAYLVEGSRILRARRIRLTDETSSHIAPILGELVDDKFDRSRVILRGMSRVGT